MSALLMMLVNKGPMLLVGTTVILGLGCLATRLHRAPIHRQRLGELTIACTAVWLVLATLPLPRPLGFGGLAWRSLSVQKAASDVELPEEFVESSAKIARSTSDSLEPKTSLDSAQSVDLSLRTTSGVGAALTGRGSDRTAAVASVKSQEMFRSGTWVRRFVPEAISLGSQDWKVAIALLYVGGSLACFGWVILGSWLLRRIVWTARRPDPWLQRTFEELTESGRARRTRLLISQRYSGAMSFGVLLPTIVLPLSECRPENLARLRHVLLHELAHIRRCDAVGNLAFNLAFPLLYFHPCFWGLRSRVRTAAEIIADEWAVRDVSREEYARELIAFVRACRRKALQPAGAIGILSSPTLFERRMEMLIRREHPLATHSSRRWRLATFAGFGLFIAVLAAGLGAAPPGPASADKGPERRLKTVEQRLKAVERERDELRKQAAALELQLQELRRTLETLVRETQARQSNVSSKPLVVPGPNVQELRPVDFIVRDDLEGVCDVQVSRDGKWLYSASFEAGAIDRFAVEANGHLRHLQTLTNPGLRGTTSFRIFHDGRLGAACACFAKTVALVKREPASGKLEIEKIFTAGDEESIGLNWPVDVAISPDSRFVYVADSHGPGEGKQRQRPGGEVTILQPTAEGRLKWVDSDIGQDRCFTGARGVLCHPSGRLLFVTSHRAGTLVICQRDQESGLIDVQQIFRQGESGVTCLQDAMTSALSPDGRFLYTAAGNFGKTGAIGVFRISDDGTATLTQQIVNGNDGFVGFVGGNKVIVSPNGRRLYATATGSGALACFERDPETGRLTHLKTLHRTEKDVPLAGANGLAFDRTGRFLFVGCEEGRAIAVFECPQ